MTLNELAETLPNGFHDSRVVTIMVDYARRELRFGMRIWVGDLYSPDEIEREAYRTAVVTLSGLLFCVIEPPDPRYPYRDADALTIDTDTVDSLSGRQRPETARRRRRWGRSRTGFSSKNGTLSSTSRRSGPASPEEELDSGKPA